MLTPIEIAILIKPVAMPVFLAVAVWPIAWLLYRVIPESRLKVILFKVRSGNGATRRDKVVMYAGVLAGYALLFALIGWHST